MSRRRGRKACAAVAGVAVAMAVAALAGIAAIGLLACRSCTAFLDDRTRSYDAPLSQDEFFSLTGGWDWTRIPLLPPYQAASFDDDTWMIDLRTDKRFQPTVANIRKLGVAGDSHIVTYSTDGLVSGERVAELWSVIVPDKDLELAFTSEHEYRAYLLASGVEVLDLVDGQALYREFLDKGCLDWFPDEYRD